VKRWTAVLLLALVAGCGDDDAPASKPPAAQAVGRLICTGSGSPERLLHDRPVVLVGASFGGYVAQLYASRNPDAVRGVVLVDSLHPDIDRTFARLFGKEAAAARARQLAGNSEHISFDDLGRQRARGRGRQDIPGGPAGRAQARHLVRPGR